MINKVNTTKRDRFLRLAESRTNKLLKALSTLSHCSNRSLYEYRDEEVDKIFTTIEKALSDIRVKFIQGDLPKFKL